jgi:protein-disulfide isomerase
MSAAEDPLEAELAFTVASVWRQHRISCPHPDLLQSWLVGGLPAGAAEFVDFHLHESQCPYCRATVEDLRAREDQAKAPALADLRDRLLRSTTAALRRARS